MTFRVHRDLVIDGVLDEDEWVRAGWESFKVNQ